MKNFIKKMRDRFLSPVLAIVETNKDQLCEIKSIQSSNQHELAEIKSVQSSNQRELAKIQRIIDTNFSKQRELLDQCLTNMDINTANKQFMAELAGGGGYFRFWFNSSDREMGLRMATETYEPHTVSLIKQYVKEGMNCLDIGAQTGYYSMIMASIVKEKGKVISFEPLISSYQLLVRNINENSYNEIITPHNCACSDKDGSIDATHVSNMIVIGNTEDGNAPVGETVVIKTIRIDDVVQDRIDIIKMDIEGHEPSAISGMKKLISKYKPVIFSEINAYWLGKCSNYSASDYIELLNSLQYIVFDVNNMEKPLIADEVKLDILETIDIIALAK